MKTFPVNKLEPGRYFTNQVFLDGKYILLSPETPLTAELVNRLKRWRFAELTSDGSVVDTPTAETAAGAEVVSLSIEQDIKENAQLQEAQKYYGELLQFIERMFTVFVTRNELQERVIGDMVKRTIEIVRSHRRYILRLAEMRSNDKNYIVDHSAKTTILALSLGMTLKLPPHKLIELGTAALLHEIGMIRLPAQLYMSDKQLTAAEKKAISAHTLLGFKILKEFSFSMTICLAVLECRENIDGSGYPRGITGERISLFAKIVMVAGSYSAITSKRPFRSSNDGHTAVMDMLKRKGQMYDETVLRALVVILSIYPIGTYVQLADGTKGMVVDTTADSPRCPHVRVISGPRGEIYAEQPVVDTGADPSRAVVRALPSEEFEALSGDGS